MFKRSMSVAVLAGCVSQALVVAAARQPAASQPVTTKVVSPDAPLSSFTSADELLAALEQADKGLRTLTADLVYDRTFATAGDQQTRVGKLYFQVGGEAAEVERRGAESQSRKFAIHFSTIVIGGRIDRDERQYIFDGQWLLEKYPGDKRATKRQVVPPGETFDPLRIGEGPMPIPIGQKREDITARYTTELLPAESGIDPEDKELIEFVKGSYQLRLVPRPERADEDKFTEIRLWYRADAASKGRLLPRMAKTINARAADAGQEGDESLVRLTSVEQNAAIPAGAIDTEIPGGWDAQVVPFRESSVRAASEKSGGVIRVEPPKPNNAQGESPIPSDDAAEDDPKRTQEPKSPE